MTTHQSITTHNTITTQHTTPRPHAVTLYQIVTTAAAVSVCSEDEIKLISEARDLLSVYRQNEDLINVGAYVKNSNSKIDRAIDKFELLETFLRQKYDKLVPRAEAFSQLFGILS